MLIGNWPRIYFNAVHGRVLVMVFVDVKLLLVNNLSVNEKTYQLYAMIETSVSRGHTLEY